MSQTVTAITLILLLSHHYSDIVLNEFAYRGRGRAKRFGTRSISFPPGTLLEVNCYRFPVLSSLPHTLCLSCRSSSCPYVSVHSSPDYFTSLPSFPSLPSFFTTYRCSPAFSLLRPLTTPWRKSKVLRYLVLHSRLSQGNWIAQDWGGMFCNCFLLMISSW